MLRDNGAAKAFLVRQIGRNVPKLGGKVLVDEKNVHERAQEQ